MRVISPALPVGAIRRYGRPSAGNPHDRPASYRRGRSTLIRGAGWIAAHYEERLLGVVKEDRIVAELASSGVVIFAFGNADDRALVRWNLVTNTFEPLAKLAEQPSKLGCSADATLIAVVVGNRSDDDSACVVRVLDGNGAPLWEREVPADESDDSRDPGPLETIIVEPDVVSLHFHQKDDDDHAELFSLARVTRDAVTWQHDYSRPVWACSADARREYGDRALGLVAISYDGTRIATARAAWTRPEGEALNVPEIYDGGMSSSWGSEASIDSLAFDGSNELLRASYARIERCFTNTAISTHAHTLVLPWTDRVVVKESDIVRIDSQILTTVSRDARVVVAFDGSAIAVVDGPYAGQEASIFDASGGLIHKTKIPSGGMLAVAPNGTALACNDDGGFKLVQLPTGDERLVYSDSPPAFSPDGKTIAYGWIWRLYLMDVATGNRVSTSELTSPITGVCYGRDGAIFTELADGTVVEWNLVPPS